MTPCLLSHIGAPSGEGHWGEGCWGARGQEEGHQGACRHLPIRRAAADPHTHLRWFLLPQLVTELSPPGEVDAASQAPHSPAHGGDESVQCVVLGEVPRCVSEGHVPQVVGVGHSDA